MLNDKQRLFCQEYIKDCNAMQAAIRAGYAKTTARARACYLLENVGIKAEIQRLLSEIEKNKIADAAEVMRYLTSVVRSESRGAEIVIEGQGDGISEARIIDKPPSEKDRLKAAELLCKRYGLLNEKVELSVPDPIVISGGDALED